MFTADAANLDDFLFKNHILHTETPVGIFESSASDMHCVFEYINSIKHVLVKEQQKPSKTNNFIIDEDSPTISKNNQLTLSEMFSLVCNDPSILSIRHCDNSLYLQNCELLI